MKVWPNETEREGEEICNVCNGVIEIIELSIYTSRKEKKGRRNVKDCEKLRLIN